MIPCDCCGEEWEAGFFCKTCCDQPETVDDVEDDPLDYSDNPKQILVSHDIYRSVCLNCCPGHRSALQHSGEQS
jgi:hypothetical protein